MTRQKTFKVFAAYLLTICLLAGLFPGVTLTSVAAEDTPVTVVSSHHNTNQGDGITLMKKAEPKDDGTVDISIGAYTTGEVVSHETATPTDIVLVLDVSGSMDYEYSSTTVIKGYSPEEGGSYTEWYFVIPVTQYGLGDGDFYIDKDGVKIPVSYAGTDDNNYDYYTDGSNYYYPSMEDYTNQEYTYDKVQFYSADAETTSTSRMDLLQASVKAFIADIAARNTGIAEASQHRVAIVTYAESSSTAKALTAVNSDTKASFDSTIDGLTADGATRIDYGMSTAYDILTNKTSTVDRENVVIAFTDGVPTTNTAFNQTVAGNAINTGADIKKSGATIYTVSMAPGANASADISGVTSSSSEEDRTNQFMHFLSSNFPNSSYANSTLSGGTGGSTSNGYYMTTDTSGLEQIFDKISTQIGTPHITMGSSAVLTDSISSYFDLTGVTDGNGKNSSITLKTVAKTAEGWAETGVEDQSLSYTLSEDDKTIQVTGFDFDENYVSAQNRGTTEAPNYGKMLLITINVKPNYQIIDAGASVHNGNVPTNADNAFLADSNGETRAQVAKPTLALPKVTYSYTIDGANETVYKSYYRLPNSADLSVEDPISRTGYTFGGWETSDVTVNDGKYTMPNKHIEFTGNLTPIKYNVTYVYSGGDSVPAGAPELPTEPQAAYNSTVEVADPAVLSDYTFVGWTPLGEDIVVTDNKFTMPARDVTLVGHFEPSTSTPYKVEHYLQDLEGGGYTLKDTEDKVGVTGETATAVPKTTYTGFTFDEDNPDNKRSGEVSSSLVLKLYYNRNTYKVTYLIDGAVPDGVSAPLGDDEVKFGATVNVANNLEKDGYVFSGWTNDTIPTDPNYVAITAGETFTMPAADVNISGYFTVSDNTPYTVLHYLENLDGTYGDGNGGGDPAKTEQFAGETDTTATANPVNFTGFKFDDGNTSNVTSGNIAGDGSLVLKLYYTRNVYSVSYLIDGNVFPDGVSAPLGDDEVKFGKTVTVEPNLTADGYTFTGWKNDAVPTDPNYVAITAGGTFTMPAANVVISGSFFRDTDTKYTVEHYLENIDGTYGDGNGGTVAAKTEQFAGETDTEATATPVNFTGFKFDAGNTSNVTSGNIAGDGSLVLKLYYTRDVYSVSYLIDGNVFPDGVSAPDGDDAVKFGETVTVEPNLTADGYTFTGWKNDAVPTDPNYVAITAGGTFTMPAANVVIAGSFIHNTNTKYTVEHYLENVTGSTNEYGDGNGNATPAKTETFTGVTDAEVTANSVIFTGYTFDKDNTNNISKGNIESNGTLVLKLYYTRDTYNLTYVYNGVVPDDAPDLPNGVYGIEHGAIVEVADKVAADTPDGYNFHGWTLFETGEEVEGEIIMPTRDVVLVGHFHAHTNVPYRIEHYLQNLDGTYPETPYSHESRTGTTNTEVTVYAHKYNGFAVDEAKINANNTNPLTPDGTTNYTLSGTVQGDGSLKLKFYYKRNAHTLTYKFDGMIPSEVNAKRNIYETVTMNVPFGTPLNVTVIPADEYVGYTFSGWKTDDVDISDGKFDMPNNDVILTGSFTANLTKYTVKHWQENLDGDTNGTLNELNDKYYTLADTEEHTDRRTGALVEAVPKNYTGFSPRTDNVLEGHITGDGSLVLNVYYDRHRYNVGYSYHNDGEQPDNRPSIPAEYAKTGVQYGTKLEVEDGMTLSGYNFDGWHTMNATVTEEDGALVYTMPDHDVMFLGSFDKKTPTKPQGGGGGGGGANTRVLTYESNGGTEYDNETYGYGKEVDITKTPEKEGYTFEGWYLDENFTEEADTVTMNKNITVYAKWHYTGDKHIVPDGLEGDDHFAYVIGYPDGTVRPSANITRAEVAAIFFRLLKNETRAEYLTDANNFADIADDAWYKTNVATLAALGIVEGRTATEFKPDEMITRAEFAAICARFDNSETDIVDTFTDVAGHWAEADIHEAAAHGWIKGYEDNTFRPEQFITRAEAMTLINRVLCRVPEKTSDLLDGMAKWSDNMNEDAWYYLAIQEATNSHNFSMKDETYEKWTSINEIYDWAKYQD